MSQTTTSEVVEILNEAATTIETETSDLAGGVRAVVADEDIGKVMGALRRNGFEFESKRDPSGDNLVINIEAEEQKRLGDLFR
jgi:hypothetical protein